MKRPGALYKWAAVTSAVLLVSGFIAYQAGAFNRVMGMFSPKEERILPSSKVGKIIGFPTDEEAATVQPLPEGADSATLMYSSKYIVITPVVKPKTPTPTPETNAPMPE